MRAICHWLGNREFLLVSIEQRSIQTAKVSRKKNITIACTRGFWDLNVRVSPRLQFKAHLMYILQGVCILRYLKGSTVPICAHQWRLRAN